ncbi:uncharacterized protein [Miscanthus floridulus]|uniref:uncharacterized protein n=1 Tax=Miscanthus floridulus TaxID=154761 RepID=UPI0034594B1C
MRARSSHSPTTHKEKQILLALARSHARRHPLAPALDEKTARTPTVEEARRVPRESMAGRSFLIRSPKEEESDAAVREAVLLGAKNAAIAGTVVAVPTLVGCRVLPWAKANLNYTAQALIISAACIAGFFITADKTILRNARQNTIGKLEKST